MKRFSTLIPFLALLAAPLLNAQLNTGNVQGFGWARGTYNLIQNVTINRMTFTGPADSLYYDILVSGFDIYGEQVGDGFNGAGEFGYIIATGYTAPLQGPGPMGQQPETNSLGPWFWNIPNEGRLHNPAPGGYFLTINFYSENPDIDPNAFLVQSMGDDRVFVEVEADLYLNSVNFSAGNYSGGDFITLQATFTNGDPFFGFADPPPQSTPIRETRPISPLAMYRIDFRLSTDPFYEDTSPVVDDFALHTMVVMGDGKNGQSLRDSWFDPAESVTVTTDALLPRNFPGIYFLGVEINSTDTTAIRDIFQGNDILVSSDTARINLRPTNSPNTYPVSEVTNANGFQQGSANEYSESPSVSGDGSRIAFISRASNLAAGDTNGLTDIFVRHRDTGDIQIVSINSNGELANRDSQQPAISANGTFITFASQASNLVDGDIGGFSDIFVHNVETGDTVRISKRIVQSGTITYITEPNGSSFAPSISEDGRFIAFSSFATNLDKEFDGRFPRGGVALEHIYVHDRCLDGDPNRYDLEDNVATYLISSSSSGDLANASSSSPSISMDGQWMAFGSTATNLNAAGYEPNEFQQVFRRRLFEFEAYTPEGHPSGPYKTDVNGLHYDPHHPDHLQSVTLVSIDADGNPGNSDSYDATLDGFGNNVAFVSEADNLDSRMTDSNGVPDIFVRTYRDFDGDGISDQQQTVRVSISSGGNEAIDVEGTGNLAAGSLMPSISRDGRYVAFRSHADNITHLTPLVNGFSDIFLHDRDFDGNGTYDEVALSGVKTEAVSVNRFGYATSATTADPSASSRSPSISADGRFVAFTSDSENTGGLRFGRTNLFPLDSNNFRDIFLYDQNTNVSSILPERYPPFVSILDPTGGSQFTVGSTFFVRAYATDIRGTSDEKAGVEKVEFIVNGEVVAEDYTAPYSTIYSPTDEGSYSIRARATDLDGYVTFSDPVLVNAIISPARLPEVNLAYPRNGQAFPTNQDVPLLAEILGDPNITGATFQSLTFFVDGEQAVAGNIQPDGLYQAIYRFLSPGEHKINAVVQYQLGGAGGGAGAGGGGGGGGGATIQAISNTVTINILSETGSLAPSVQILYPPDRSSITSASKVRLLASASDPDGNLVGVQFYVNGLAYGAEVLRTSSHSPNQFPFGMTWSPDSPGSYEITCVARDSSGNLVTSFPVRITSTTGVNPPSVQLTQPFTPPEANVHVEDGVITSIDLINGREGNRLFSAPEIVITGIHDKAEASVDSALMVNGGVGPVPSDGTGITVTHPGSGYVRTPSVTIAGDGTGAKAFARRVSGEVQDVIVRNPGIDYTTARVIFSGGHSEANANAVMVDGTLQSIQISQGGSGYLSGTINHINVSNLGSGYISAPTIILSDPPGVGTTAQAVSQINFEGQLQRITITDMGSGYDAEQAYTGSTISYDATTNSITSTTPAFLSFLQSLVVGGDFTLGEILYDSIRIDGSDQNDGEYSVVSVSNSGLEVFPNLVTESAGLTVRLTASPAPPTVTIIGGEGIGARAEAIVTRPSVTFREVRNIQDSVSAQAHSAILLSAAATDEGVVNQIEFYANGVLVPSNLPDSAYWTPNIAGIYEVVAIAIDDDGNAASSTPVEFRITEPEPSSALLTLISPVSSNNEIHSFATGSSIDLTAWAVIDSGSITQVDFYANGVLIDSENNPIGTDDNGHYTVNWRPSAPGSYTITAYATDSLGQVVGLNNSQSINVTNSSGSRPPAINLVYPPASQTTITTTDPETGVITTTTRNNPTYITDESTIRLTALSNDPDGDLERVRFYVNGAEVDAITGYLKFKTDQPADGDWIELSDGINSSLIFEFNSFGGISPNRVEVTVTSELSSTRDNFIAAISHRASLGELELRAYPVGSSGVFLEHLSPSGIDATNLSISSNFRGTGSLWSRGLVNGVLRYPTSNPEDHPFSVEWKPGIVNGPGIYTVSAVAEDYSGNKTMSSSVSISSTTGSGSVPTITLQEIAENNMVTIPPETTQETTGQIGGVFGALGGQVTANSAAWATIYVDELDDTDGEVMQVEFFVNGSSIGIDYEGRHQMRWTPTEIGFYEVYATARDDRGNISATDVQKILVVHQGSVETGYSHDDDNSIDPNPDTGSDSTTGKGNGPLVQITYPKRKADKLSSTEPDVVIDIASPLDITVHAEPRDGDPFSLVQRVEVYVNLERTPIGTLTAYPYNVSYNPSSLGMYKLKAVAYDINQNTSESDDVIIQVVDQSNTGSFDLIEADKPYIDLQSPLDGSEIFVGQRVELVALARPSQNQTHTIQRVDFFANNAFLASSFAYPYQSNFSTGSYGDYEFKAVVYDVKGVTNTSKTVTVHVIEDPLSRPNSGLQPFSNDSDPDSVTDSDRRREGDFVLAIHRGLVWLNPTRGEYEAMTEDLVHGRITREQLTELLMTGSYYGSFRDLSMAHYLLKQVWPNRRESLFNYSLSEMGVIKTPPPVNTVDVIFPEPVLDEMTSTSVGKVDFGIRNPQAGNAPAAGGGNNNQNNANPTRLTGLEAVVEYYQTTAFDLVNGTFDEKENDEFFELLFLNKYGVEPTPLQAVRGQKVINKKFEEMGGVIDPSKMSYGGGGGGGRGNNNFGGNNNNQNNVNFEDQNLRTLHNSKRFILQDFVRDNTFVYAGGLTYTEDMKIPYPPNNRLSELADANTINTAIMGSDAASHSRNLEIMAMGDLKTQITYAINSQEFKARFRNDDSTGTTIRMYATDDSTSAWTGAQMVANGWMNLDWFGFFYHGNAPWVFHKELGWLYNKQGTADNLWLWHEGLGWCWTTSEQYPHLYSTNYGWVYFQSGTTAPCYFYDYDDSQWRTH